MNAHFLLLHASNDWPLVNLIREQWPDATLDCRDIKGLTYRTRIEYAVKLLKFIWYGFSSGLAALGRTTAPAVLCAGSDLEVIGFSLARFLRRKTVPIVLTSFIYTARESRLTSMLRKAYFRFVLGRTIGVICHSKLERERYSQLFPLANTRFVKVPYGLHVDIPASIVSTDAGYIFSAGRSGRDYALLGRVVSSMKFELRIVCDAGFALGELAAAPNVAILRNCYGDDYFRQLAGAKLVVLPLKSDDISAGQMVLLQAMALGKSVVITRTPTTEEYGEHLRTVYFVEKGNEDHIAQAVRLLAQDRELRITIGQAAQEYYRKHHSIEAFARGLVMAIDSLCAAARN